MLGFYDGFMNVYDFDNTIYQGDSTFDFYLFCLKRHKKIITLFPSLCLWAVKFFILKKVSKTEFKENMFRFLSFAEYPKDLEDFWKTHKNNIKSWYLKNKKDDDVIISASPYFLLEPICKELGIKHLIASDVDKKTGKYSGENCHGKEKVKRYKKIFPNGEIDKFYSDSKSDTPLAEISKQAFIVHGDKTEQWKF